MNCQELCPYKQQCVDFFGCHGHETEDKHPHADCPMAWKIEDVLNDARDIAREIARGIGDEE